MSAALVQSIAGGSASGTVGHLGTITSSPGGFASPTTPGNLIVLVGWTRATSGINPPLSSSPVVSGGYGASWSSVALGSAEQCTSFLYFIPDAPSMSPSQTITVEATNEVSGVSTIAIEWTLYEFSGVAPSPIYDLSDVGSFDMDDGPTPNDQWVSGGDAPATPNTDLIICVLGAYPGGSNISAGSGYTLGINASVVTVGQMEYQLNAPPGQTGAFFSGTEPTWCCVAIAFSTAPTVTITGVSPSSGPTAGGTSVTITGTDFLSGATVSFGGNAATSVVVVSSTSITCVTPAHAAGSVTVSVTDTDGTGSLANAYLYTEPILDVSPSTLGFGAVLGGSNPFSQNVSVSNGDGGTLSWSVSSDESWLTASPTSGINFGTVAASVNIAGLAIGSYTGHLTFSASGALDSPQVVTVTLSIALSGGGGGTGGSEYMFVYFPFGTEVDFTPVFSPVAKQPEYQWGLEAKRADSIAADGQKSSVCERIDQVTTVKFPFVALSDMAAWKEFESYALGGGTFFYRPNIGWPDDTGFLTCAMVSMDWTPKFNSFQNFSLDMKLRLVEEAFVGS